VSLKGERLRPELTIYSSYFPPTAEDLNNSSAHTDKATDIAKGMPDPPTTEPVAAGEPDAKKQKMTAEPNEPEDWEHVDKPAGSDSNGYPNITREFRSTSIDEDAMTQEEKEEKNAALHTATMGGDVPINALEKDW
jgi:hypothetical protein